MKLLHKIACLVALAAVAEAEVESPKTVHYYDEASFRHVMVTEGEKGAVSFVVRWSNPDYFTQWIGDGIRKEDELIVSQITGEDTPRGTHFVGKIRESKLEIAYVPGELEPQDAGINGNYSRISADKVLSLAKKEYKAADDHLDEILKTAPKTWPGADRRVLGPWKDRWPGLRENWVKLVFEPAALPASDRKALEGKTEYWIALMEATGLAQGFIAGTMFEKAAEPGWDGEYDDGFGGHVSLRRGADRSLILSMSYYRGSGMEPETSELTGRIPAASQAQEGDVFTANYTHTPPELPTGTVPAKIKLRKAGHFLTVETQDAGRYVKRGWFDGVYRWGPVPVE